MSAQRDGDEAIVVRALDRRAQLTLVIVGCAAMAHVLLDWLLPANLHASPGELIAVLFVVAARYGSEVVVGPKGIDRPGVGMIWWDDIERVEVGSRLGGLVKSTRLVLRKGQRSALFQNVPLGDFGRRWPNNALGKAVIRFCPRLIGDAPFDRRVSSD